MINEKIFLCSKGKTKRTVAEWTLKTGFRASEKQKGNNKSKDTTYEMKTYNLIEKKKIKYL